MEIKIYRDKSPLTTKVKKGDSLSDILSEKDPSLLEKYAVAWNGREVVDFHTSIEKKQDLELLPWTDERILEAYWHTTSHIMAQAARRLYEVKLAIGPAIDDGFYYDMETEEPFSDETLEKISVEMDKIINEDYRIEREVISREKARELFDDNKFKLELIEEIDSEELSIYKQGEFVDLCRGPHLISTGKVNHFLLTSVAGSYWRGDEDRESLQRIYGISFPMESQLKEYKVRIKEARERDHRKIGNQLDLFNIYEEGGPGLIVWHPKGTIVREIMEDYWKKEHVKRGYQLVKTPHIARAELWHRTGHFDFYRENMYTFDVDDEEYVVKPMNCPYHILIYKSDTRSYRDLPMRLAELGTVYRNERSGVLHGMLRVRGFTVDDGHIFCKKDQVEDEIGDSVDFALDTIKTFGYSNYIIHLSVRDPENKDKYAGSDENWEKAEKALVKALESRELNYERLEGEAVFYGPKIDIHVKDALGRLWQGPTIQFDFNLPGRLGMTYVGEDGEEHTVYMIHRALFGSVERFFGGLIEHYKGNFPLWLAPVQIKVLTINDEVNRYAEEIYTRYKEEGFRIEIDKRNEKLSKKIRDAENQKIPYQFIIGNREVENNNISVRHHQEGDIGTKNVDKFLLQLKEEIKARR